jgi:hypothetical protein
MRHSLCRKEHFNTLNFLDNVGKPGGVGCSFVFIDGWDHAHRAAEVNGKRGQVESPHFNNLIGSVAYHIGLGDERQSQDDIHCDVASCGNDEAGWGALTSQVGQVELEPDHEIHCNGLATLLDNTTQSNQRVVMWAVDGGDGVGVCFRNCCKEVQVPHCQCGSSVYNTPDGRAIPATRADPNCKVMCGNAAWIGTGRTQQEGGIMLNTGIGKLSMKTWGLPPLEVLVVTDNVVLLEEVLSVLDMARMVS